MAHLLQYPIMDHEKDVNLLKQIIKQLAELDMVVKTKLRLFLKGKDDETIEHYKMIKIFHIVSQNR